MGGIKNRGRVKNIERNLLIVDAVKSGKSVPEIADAHFMSASAVRTVLYRAGVTPPGKKRPEIHSSTKGNIALAEAWK